MTPENLPELDVSEETDEAIELATKLIKSARKKADDCLAIASRIDDYRDRLVRLALAYAQLAQRISNDVGELVSMDWDLEAFEEKEDEDED